MPENATFKEFEIKPVSGLLDTRSTPDEVPENGYRWLEYVRVTQQSRVCRQTGYQKAFSKDDYNNEDYHDQLGYTREDFEFGFSAASLAGFSKLFLASKSRIGAFNNSTGNWALIADSLSAAPESAAVLNNIVVFTNNLDAPKQHFIDQPLIDGQSVDDIPDLARLKVTKVGVVYSWNNLMFYANMVMDGQRITNRVIWSDYKRPLSIYPSSGSLAGRFDFHSGDHILAILELGDSLFFYTANGTWECRATGGTQVLAFHKRYSAQKGLRCLAYKNTLVSDGDSHYYWGSDGIYKYDFYETKPVRVDWVHRASAVIFDDMNTADCSLHVGGFNHKHKEIWWSWARGGESKPSMTFVINTEYPFSYFMPKGFMLFVNHFPFKLKSLREWLLENCICNLAELDLYGGGFIKEGGFCVAQTDISCPTRPTNFASGTLLVDETDPEIESEDYLNTPDPTSLHALLGIVVEEDICGAEYRIGECNAEPSFLMVSIEDQCLKEAADVYFHELCTGFTGCGLYQKRGYQSLARSGPIALRKPSDDKTVNRFAMEIHPSPATVPATLKLRIGVSANAVDPNSASGRCVIQYEDEDDKLIECLSDADVAQHAEDQTRPYDEVEWPLYQTGRFFYYEWRIVNDDVEPKDTGGAVCISRYSFNMSLTPRPVQ